MFLGKRIINCPQYVLSACIFSRFSVFAYALVIRNEILMNESIKKSDFHSFFVINDEKTAKSLTEDL